MKKITLIVLFACLMTTLTAWAKSSLNFYIMGTPENIQKEIITLLNTERDKFTEPLTTEQIDYLFQIAPNKIENILHSNGYFKTKINQQINYQKNYTNMIFRIELGPALRIYNLEVTISGDGLFDSRFKRFLNKLPIQSGQVLNLSEYEKVKDTLFNIANSRGYFDAKIITSQININLQTYQADIKISFDTGHRYHFGITTFSETDLNPHLLERYLRYHLGDPYNSARLQMTQQGLINSGFFRQVVVTPNLEQAENYNVPIDIQLVPNYARQYIFGLGYGTDTGPRVTLGLTIPQVNSYGHRFNTLLRISPADSHLTAAYTIPGKNPVNDLFSINAALGDLNQESGESRSGKIGVSYSTLIWHDSWQQRINLDYLKERYNLAGFNMPKTNTELIIPSIHWQNNSKIKQANPDHGYNIYIDLAGAHEGPLTQTDFVQGKAEARGLYTLTTTNTRLLGHIQAGHTVIGNIENLPFSLQLLAGGSTSIRGYQYNAIGPGRNLFVAGAEIQQKIYGNWYGAAFYDFGNVANDNLFSDLKHGIGPGIVWLSPVGPIEVNLARALSNSGNAWRIHVNMGPSF